MQLKDFIRADEGFQYSINLQYDLNKLSKVNGYIPTSMSLEIMKEYLKNIYYDSKERATVLIGPYGKGKSHLMLILLAIASLTDGQTDEKENLNSKEVMTNLMNKIKSIDSALGEMIQDLREQNKRLVPIIINSNYLDLNQAFIIALKEALNKEGLDDLIPNTYFDSVLETIDVWEKRFFQTFKLFKNKLKNYGFNFKDFINSIKKYEEKAYLIFKEIHPEITSGVEFNPLINSDIVKLYEEVNAKICENQNYRGMYIVFDEFSKFLETGISRNSAKDIKTIQDFAELANRSGNSQIHFTCITHKAINDYISRLPREKIDAWRAVEGRFKEIYFTSSSQQNYELIANAIKKDKKLFEKFLNDNNEKFEDNLNICSRLGLFEGVLDYRKIIGEDCYPLNPSSAYVLPRVSEKVAQNERTLFTFLARDERGSLVRFINTHKGEIKFLTIDWIYDYFEILFKKEVFNQNVHSLWLKADSILLKIDNGIERKIVKAIAIIYIVNELNRFAPIDVTIHASLSIDKAKYDDAVNSLISKHILIKKKSNSFYEFLANSNVNIGKNIEAAKELKAYKINLRATLEGIADLGYVTPKRYNDNYEMIRFFKRAFITTEELLEVNKAENILDIYKSDGVILNLIYTDVTQKGHAIERYNNLNSKRILLCIPDKPFNKVEELREYAAIQYLKNDEEFIKQDDFILQELTIYESDVVDDISSYIQSNFIVENNNCRYYKIEGEIEGINNSVQFNREISKICEEIFSETPKINNEMINKMNISSPILKARNKIIKYIFEEIDKEDREDLSGSGPEVTIFRVAIANKEFDDKGISGNDINLNIVLKTIEIFIKESQEDKHCFGKLYSKLYGKKFGLRSGIIPIYLALKMKDYKDSIVIYYGDKEISLSIDALNGINNNPEKYYMLLEKGTVEKTNYINSLYELFKDYRSSKEIGYSKFSNIVAAMQRWVQSLPKYSREYEMVFLDNNEINLERNIILLRKELLKYDINPREFLYERLRNKILQEEQYDLCLGKLKNAKNKLDIHIGEFKKTLINRTKKIFDKDYEGELSTLLKYWYVNLSDNSKKHAYDLVTNNLLGFVGTMNTFSDNQVIESMARAVTGLNIEDWNDDTFRSYLEDIVKAKEIISSYKDEVGVNELESYQLSFYVKDQKVDKIFENVEISPIGRTLFDEIDQIFDEYAESIEINEKRNILMQLMKKFM